MTNRFLLAVLLFAAPTVAFPGKLDDALGKLKSTFNNAAPLPTQRSTSFSAGKMDAL